ncbi:repressor [Leuconostoc garlicum]|uniref:Repressor n=2 Tax=Leuconostoc TaxID=1243 RepID=A0ABM6HU77_9LACO|nr:S24 family peptidase [Leuconostoc garlicum]AQN79926.1 repressor [Leuconostoc garlicum]
MNKDLSSDDGIRDKVISMYDSLDANRQQAVYNFTKQQYNEQNNVIEFPAPTRTQVSVYGAVSAGTGEYLLDGTPELVDYDGAVPEHDFAVIVNGDSMEPTFEDKQIIFVKKTNEARNGQFVIADYDHQAFVKKFMRDEHGARLVSLNKNYPDMLIDEEHELSIFGVVVF